MNKGLLIFIGVIAASGIGLALYVHHRKTTPDKLTIQIGNVDYVNKKVPYSILENGKKMSSGTYLFRDDLVGKGIQMDSSDGKNITYQQNDKDTMTLTGTSLGVPQYKAIVDFNKKTTITTATHS